VGHKVVANLYGRGCVRCRCQQL